MNQSISDRLYEIRQVLDICDLSFPSKSGLRQHENKHKETKFTCQDCGKQFASKTILTRHIKCLL